MADVMLVHMAEKQFDFRTALDLKTMFKISK